MRDRKNLRNFTVEKENFLIKTQDTSMALLVKKDFKLENTLGIVFTLLSISHFLSLP